MKNKIKQFSKGDFKTERPDIRFSETSIYMSVSEGEVYEGSFLIENTKDGKVRGLVYPSSFRVHCLEAGFEGNPVEVKYTYDSTGLKPGEMEKGNFTVVCNGGEYDIDFTAVVEKPYIMTPYGKIQTMAEFRKLAMQDFAEAKRLIYTRQFGDLLKYEDCRVRNLYANMRKWALDEQALEEFLVGIKQKEKIFLTLSRNKVEYDDLLEEKKSQIHIVKNTWGYVPIKIRTYGTFLDGVKESLTTDDFVGSNYALEYIIRKDRLHAGYNYGKIEISTPYETVSAEICVHQSGQRDSMRGMSGIVAGKGLKEYLSFISGKTDLETWVAKALKRVEQLRELDPQNEYYSLLQAHICIVGGREEEAKWILDNGNYSKFAIGRKPENSAYYLFLTALLKKETLHTNRVLEELNRSFMKHLHSWPILCMIVNLDPRYRDYTNRIRVLERQFFNGANHVLLYAEAYKCFQEDVLLLRKMESFEVQILNFATKYKIISNDLALHMADIISQQKRFDEKWLRILIRAYEIYEDKYILRAICMQLIKGNKVGKEYVKWYEAAVKAEIKIAQLYEYYMMSLDLDTFNYALPRIVYLYFLHGINLDYRREALLYANILTYEKEDSEVYKQYHDNIKTFATEQLLKRHVDDSLRIIYNRFIHPTTITLEELDAMRDICHAYHVTTDMKGMKYVLVIEKDGSVRQRVAYKEGKGAIVYLYDKEARIVWEADNGVHFTDSVPYETRRLFYEMRFLELCKERMQGMNEYKTEEVPRVSFESLKQYGMKPFDKQDIFLLCSKRIREQEQVEDDFLLYVCMELIKDDFYDKALLQYMAQYYCGATKDMKFVWRKAKEYGVNTKPLAERIITQMLFSETMFNEEEIFVDYYTGKPYFRLKQAYLAYVARMYLSKNRELSKRMIHVMLQEFEKQEYLADICKAAILKYYADKEKEPALLEMLKPYFDEMCKNHMVFPFFLQYPQKWLKEVQLYDKVLVSYQSILGGKVKVYYRMAGDYHFETLSPMYEGVYVKEFVLYEGEELKYYFEETVGERKVVTEKAVCSKTDIIYEDGKYGRLNLISRLSREKLYEEMLHYRKEEAVAKELFPIC